MAAAGFPLQPLIDAAGEASRLRAAPFDVLMAAGGVPEDELVAALARAIGLEALGSDAPAGDPIDADQFALACRTGVMRLDVDGRARLLVAARGPAIGRLASSRRGRPADGRRVAIAGPRAFANIAVRRAGSALADRASLGPGAIAPELTAAVAMPVLDQPRREATLAAAAVGVAAAFAFDMVFFALAAIAGLLFFAMNLFRFLLAMTPATDDVALPRGDDGDLPIYTVLVGLAFEGAVVPGLLDALESLDYPAAKLDIKLLIEEGDHDTLGALARRPPRAGIEVLTLPPGGPKTKPRALNAGLLAARGTLLTVFDAEDRPEPDQLRRALEVFRRNRPDLACVQARLAIDNLDDGWLARQFGVEYAALFDVSVPALATLGMPIPLGGTSNHFRTSALRMVGGWDASNVTEDADLGLRLARLGWRTTTVRSTTWEEATTSLWPWLKQRTRWMKGFMVTAVVHGRSGGDLASRLGPARFVSACMAVAGVALTALAYPVVVVGLLIGGLTGSLFAVSGGLTEAAFVGVHVANLIVGYATGLACGWMGVDRRGPARLALDLFTMPIYWLLVGVAAWRALGQIVYGSSTRWEKTMHGVSNRRRTPT
ncbi:glycosyltransferase [Methylopila turkensis]|uniref:Glycosyltransferase n=1 Tax=Methylopila turkensis TaxID=1437816 RepID=A0A9W6JQV6_9HYPH|nr:glycosyltransferase [Methylopila turkensis]GLK80119.1 hypothetical protein GCM10008174_18600 [Methylopila turkensis]